MQGMTLGGGGAGGNGLGEFLMLLQSLRGLQGPQTVGQAMSQQTPMQKAMATSNKSLYTPYGTDAEEPEPAPEPVEPPVEQDPGQGGPPKQKMTVADALQLAGAGAEATGSMMPRPPSAPGLQGGRFQQIDPTTLLFLRSIMSGRG